MNPMKDAIKSKRSSSYGGMEAKPGPEGEQAPQGGGMHDLVLSLSPDQKEQLMQLLSKDVGGQGATPSAIEKGAPSDEEHAQIQARMGTEGDAYEMSDDDSDEISMAMLDSRDKAQGAQMNEPRNLGERVKQSIASKLKGKGKL